MNPSILSKDDLLSKPDTLQDEIVKAWNSRDKLPKVLKLSQGRKRHLSARITDSFFIKNWKTGIDRIEASSFCNGSGRGGWKASFDWFLRPDTLTKILEGKYDDRSPVETEKPRYSTIGEPLNEAARRIEAAKPRRSVL